MNPSSLKNPLTFPPIPTTIFLNALSFISMTLLNIILLESILKSFPWWIWLSIAAHNKLLAVVIACISPVKCKFISSIGTTWAYPPPAAPPFTPNTGPKEGSLNAIIAFFPVLHNACPNPTVTVDFPSPAGVGFIAVTSTNFPSSLFLFLFNTSNEILHLYFPYSSISSSVKFNFSAIFTIGSIFASWAIWISLFILLTPFNILN